MKIFSHLKIKKFRRILQQSNQNFRIYTRINVVFLITLLLVKSQIIKLIMMMIKRKKIKRKLTNLRISQPLNS